MSQIVPFLGATVLSGLGSRMAAGHASGTLRIPIRSGVDSIWNDLRTWLGLGGALGAALIPDKYGMAQAGAFTIGLGAATSLAATEQVRAVTVKQMQAAGAGQAAGAAARGMFGPPVAPAQIPAGQVVTPVPQVRRMGATYGAF